MSRDILDALAALRAAFIRERINPPSAIHLPTHEDGMRFLAGVAQMNIFVCAGDSRLGKPVETADGGVYMEVEVFGMAVRWPANRYATPDGKWSYV